MAPASKQSKKNAEKKPDEKKKLPAIEGFAKPQEIGGLLSSQQEEAVVRILSRKRFRDGPILCRVLANLTVLFRLLMFFADFSFRSTQFWELIESCWDIDNGQEAAGYAHQISRYYVVARKLYLDNHRIPSRDGLLAKLVDEWAKYQSTALPAYDWKLTDWTVRRKEWARLRSDFIGVLLDSMQPLRLVGIEPASKKWTNTYDDKTLSGEDTTEPSTSKLAKKPTGIKSSQKPKDTEGERSLTFIADNTTESSVKKGKKRACSPDLAPERPKKAKIKTRSWQADLQSVTARLKNQEVAIAERLRHETIGSVPSVMQPGEDDETLRREAGREAMSVSDVRLLSLEQRMAELESSAVADRRWARSMGAFLYEANEKTLGMMKDMIGVFGTLKQMCGSILAGNEDAE